MKTIEFKLSLNQAQQTKVEDWLDVQRWVWNQGLRLLEEFEAFHVWNKAEKHWFPCCPLPWEYYKDADGQLVPFTRLVKTKSYRMACPISQVYRQPQLRSPNFFGLAYYFVKKKHQDKSWFCKVPSKITLGTLKSLADAWQQFKLGKRKRPHYKGRKDKIKTLINNNAKSIKVLGKQIRLPKLGKVTVKTLDKRWLESVAISILKIVKMPSGYYLQLTGKLPTKELSCSHKAVGLAMGDHDIYITDAGKVVEPPDYYSKMEKRLARLQRKASRRQQGSANQQRIYKQISRLQEKLQRTNRALNHKLATYLVREYGGIAITKAESKKMIRGHKCTLTPEGVGLGSQNAIRKTQVDKRFLARSLTQLINLIEQKAQVNGREFIKVKQKDLPCEPRQQNCAVALQLTHAKELTCQEATGSTHCILNAEGSFPSKELSTQVGSIIFKSSLSAHKLQLLRSIYLTSFYRRYRAWAWEQTPGESQQTLNQEVSPETPPRDAGTTSNNNPLNRMHGVVNVGEITSH